MKSRPSRPLRGLIRQVHSAAARPRACTLGRYAASRLCTQPLRGLAPVYSAAARPRACVLGRCAATPGQCTRPLRGLALHKSTCTVLFYSAGISRLCPRPLRGLGPVHSAATRPRACVLSRCAASRLCTRPLRGLARLVCTPHLCKQARAPPSPRAGTPSHSISQSCSTYSSLWLPCRTCCSAASQAALGPPSCPAHKGCHKGCWGS